MKFCLSILGFLLCIGITQAQNGTKTPIHSNGYFGYSMFTPQLAHKNFEALEAWQGADLNAGAFTFAYYDGSLRQMGADSTVANVSGRLYRIGGQFGYPLVLGNNSFFSIGIEPYCRITGSLAQIPNKVVNTRVGSSGLVVSPGLKLNLSHFYLAANYDAGLYLNTTLTGGNRQHNLIRGYMGGYSLTFGINTGFDLLMPEEFTLRGLDIYKEVYEKRNQKYDVKKKEFYTEVITTTYTTFTPGQRTLSLMSPFWGIGPSYGFRSRRDRQAATGLIGVNGGLRIWYLMVDGFYEEGEVGTEDQIGKDQILINYPQLRNYDFSSQLDAQKYGMRVGLNISKLFALKVNFEQTSRSKRISELAVPFMRLNAFYTFGQVDFTSAPRYTYDGAQARLVDLQNKLDQVADASNNPNLLPTSTTFSGWGVSLEIGAVFFNMTWYQYKDASVVDHMHYTIGSNIPLGRLVTSTRARFLL